MFTFGLRAPRIRASRFGAYYFLIPFLTLATVGSRGDPLWIITPVLQRLSFRCYSTTLQGLLYIATLVVILKVRNFCKVSNFKITVVVYVFHRAPALSLSHDLHGILYSRLFIIHVNRDLHFYVVSGVGAVMPAPSL